MQSNQFAVRPYAHEDLESLYNVCVCTGNAGKDARELYTDKKLLGHVYVGPYVTCCPDLAFVLEDKEGVCGYVVAALDTNDFHDFLRATWYPTLRTIYTPEKIRAHKKYTTHDMDLLQLIQNPQLYFPPLLHSYPSELHIDILARAQGKGLGTKMMHSVLDALRNKKSKGVHLGLHADNVKAQLFYEKLGFSLLPEGSHDPLTRYMKKELLAHSITD